MGVNSPDEPAFGARPGSAPRPDGRWKAPSLEELQRDFPLYEIRGILGRGGMGAVYKGWQKSLDRFVAIKILATGLDDDDVDFTSRFKREAKAMAQLKHNGIVAVFDSGETAGGLLYFVMEYVDGTDVHRLVTERGCLEVAEAVRIASAVCDALAYAHSQGVVHRDITPANIMLDAKGTVKITDFGLAKSSVPGTKVITSKGIAIGTPDFMAPEGLQGAMHMDHRADIYAVGVMLYQMLIGRLPRGRFAPPSWFIQGLDKRVDHIVDKALQSDPVNRYSSASEMQMEIARVTLKPRQSASAGQAAAAPRARLLAKSLLVASVIAAFAIAAVVWAHSRKSAPAIPVAGSDPILPKPDGTRTSTPANAVAAATKDVPFVNTLGMEFVPVSGADVLFSRWETRVQDYAGFAAANPVDKAWKKQRKEQTDVAREAEHPVAGVSWDEANLFCKWLTEKETAAGKLSEGAHYRLPTDQEWSRAVGLANEIGATPKERTGTNGTDFPWGKGFPPPDGAGGNYADSAFHEAFPNVEWVQGYTDGYATTAPVGSFPPNAYGLHDLGGNVWEWCEDPYEPGATERVMRGGSWVTYGRNSMASAFRLHAAPDSHSGTGFRCVLALHAALPPSRPQPPAVGTHP